MSDDRKLAERLRAYESHIPDADAPDIRAVGEARSPWPGRFASGLGVVVLAATIVVVTLSTNSSDRGGLPTPPPSRMAERSQPAATQSPAARQSEPPPSTAATAAPRVEVRLDFRQTGDFGDPPGPAVVNGVESTELGVIAVGTQFHAQIPSVGPNPGHEGKVWHSSDGGETWSDVTPEGGFVNVSLIDVAATEAGGVLAFGNISALTNPEYDFVERIGSGVWESVDGFTWSEVEGAFADLHILDVVSGARGHVATALTSIGAGSISLWYSADGRAWEQVHELPEEGGAYPDVAAGEEGFVAAGVGGSHPDLAAFVLASADGRVWVQGSPPAVDTYDAEVVAVGRDWVFMTVIPVDDTVNPYSDVWVSDNGLDWRRAGQLSLERVPEGCREWITDLSSADTWLIASTVLEYPCSEGGFMVHGANLLSSDGLSWGELPFPTGTLGTAGSGSAVSAAVRVNGSIVLVGQSNSNAAMWLGDAPVGR